MCCMGVIGLIWFRIGSRNESLKMEMCFPFPKNGQNLLQGFLSSEIYCIHGSPGPNPSKHEGVMFPRNIGILLPTEVASYPRRGPLLHCCENLKTDVVSSLDKRLSHVSVIGIIISYTLRTFIPLL